VGGGHINPTQHQVVERVLELAPGFPRVLDAACGTGKYWPLLLDAGARVSGIDMSAGMLRRAAEKFPTVTTRKLSLQELDAVGAFDLIICMDAMEMVAPEDWPLLLATFQRALQSAGLLYRTVEVSDLDLPKVFQAARDAGPPFVPGEYVKDDAYHYYPELPRVRA
jgi:2-polyprenyl-3-methyl-5-hydroxy-6-metoxy-1,4-benzoquinol methylase